MSIVVTYRYIHVSYIRCVIARLRFNAMTLYVEARMYRDKTIES